MRYLLRRILWLVPSLILASLLAFASLAERAGAKPDELRLPVVFNPAPEDVRSLALGALARVAQGGAGAEEAARMLGRLGGTALPHVLPRLDGLPPDARARVAVSLAPVGRRMRVAGEDELVQPDQAVLFWTHFWEDRALEFRPAVAKRLARRLAERPLATRREEILGLDTYAMPALLDELGRVETPADVVRAASLTEILSHVTGRDGRVLAEHSPSQAATVVEGWRAWWSHHRYEYLALDGPRRIAAMVLETRYAQWAAEAVRVGLRRTPDSVVQRLGRAAPVTLGLGATGLLGGFTGGLLVALVSLYAPHSRRERASAVAILTLAALPVAVLVAIVSPLGSVLGRIVGAALLVMSLGAAVVGWYLRAAARTVRLADHYRTLVAGGARPGRIALLGGREVSVVGLSLVAVHLPEMLSAILLVEHGWGLPGIGALTVAAVVERDAVWLTVVAILCACSVWVAQALGDLALGRLDPEARQRLRAPGARTVTPLPRSRMSVRLSLLWLGLVVACALFAGLVPLPGAAAGMSGGLGEVGAHTVHGARTTVLFALAVTLIGVPLGATVGGLAGTGSRMAEFVLARGVELLGSWPSVILVALVRLVLPSGSTLHLVLLLGLVRGVHLGRLVRGETLRLAASDFACAARALGVGRVRLLGHHLFPHLGGLVLAQTALGAAWVVALEAGLTMAGLGLSRDLPSWGHLLGRARELGLASAGLPAAAIVLTTLCCGVLADAIDDGRRPQRGPAASPAAPLGPGTGR